MIDLMKQVVEALKTKVAINLEEVKKNEIRFRTMVLEENCNVNSLEITSIIENNKGLLAENLDFINIQISILRFIEKYQYLFVNQNVNGDDYSEPEYNAGSSDYFELTIKGDLPFSLAHPLFHDNTFFGQLMNYYESREEYEKCSELIKMRAFNNLN